MEIPNKPNNKLNIDRASNKQPFGKGGIGRCPSGELLVNSNSANIKHIDASEGTKPVAMVVSARKLQELRAEISEALQDIAQGKLLDGEQATNKVIAKLS